MRVRVPLGVVSWLGAWLIRLLGVVLPIRVEGEEKVDRFHAIGQGIIIAFWHDQQLMMPLAYRGNKAYILVSQHRDGEVIARIVKRFGFQVVRGSTTRGGDVAFRQLIRAGRQGADLVITPDGPQGPRHVAKAGVIHLARATGLPVIPLVFASSKKKSSQAGINFSCPCLVGEGCFSGATLCGYPPTWIPSALKPAGASLNAL
ncbi:MAG: DUF374 domain-containing protein [Nitrospirae bacterium]|nr:MAG: DUF374 domain-containing protein [Nitrospirota bacterium]